MSDILAEDLKCCGNCRARGNMDNGYEYSEYCLKKIQLASWRYCDEWEWDELTHRDRIDGTLATDK